MRRARGSDSPRERRGGASQRVLVAGRDGAHHDSVPSWLVPGAGVRRAGLVYAHPGCTLTHKTSATFTAGAAYIRGPISSLPRRLVIGSWSATRCPSEKMLSPLDALAATFFPSFVFAWTRHAGVGCRLGLPALDRLLAEEGHFFVLFPSRARCFISGHSGGSPPRGRRALR